MDERILVTGATGNVGREVIRELLARRAQGLFSGEIVAAMRHPRASAVLEGVESVAFEFGRPETYALALDGVTRLFLLRPPQIGNVRQDMFPVVDQARAGGVLQIVFLSLLGIEKQRFVPHYAVERTVRASGVPYTFLRPSFFMQNLSTTHRDDIRLRDEIMLPVGRAATSFIDVRDVGAVAATVLTQPGHAGQAYELTGGAALDYYQVAALFTEVLGREITYRCPSVLAFMRYQRRLGCPAPLLLVMAGLYTGTRWGGASRVTGEVERLLGRPPVTVRQFIEDHAPVWQRDAAAC